MKSLTERSLGAFARDRSSTRPSRARRGPSRAALRVAVALAAAALPAAAAADIAIGTSSASTSLKVMSGVFDPTFVAPVVDEQRPVTDFASEREATPSGPFPATARVSHHASVSASAGAVTANAEATAFVEVPGVPDPPLANLFGHVESAFEFGFSVTGRATVAASVQVIGASLVDLPASITCTTPGGPVDQHGTSVSVALELADGSSCTVSALLIVERVGNRDFLNPGEQQGTLRVSVAVSELGPDDGHVFRWVGAGQGAFANSGNWQNETGGSGVPGFRTFEDADTALVENQGAIDLDLAAALSRALLPRGPSRQTGRLAVHTTQTLHPVGGTLILDSLEPGIDDRSLEIGGAQLLLDQGGVSARHVVVGHHGNGSLEVAGPDGFFDTQGRFGIGGDSDGDVTIRDGAQVTSAETILGEGGGSGSASVEGPGTLWKTGNLAVGFADAAGLSIEGGARVESDKAFVDCQLVAGPDVPGCTGLTGDERAEVTVDGAGGGSPSSWVLSDDLEIGARGKVTVEGGGLLDPSIVRIGSAGGDADCIAGHACLEVLDGTVSADAIGVGLAGSGKLRIAAGGRVSGLVSVQAGGALTRGEITVVGPSAEAQLTALLTVGTDVGGHGELVLQSGAVVTAFGGDVGGDPGSDGLIELQGDAAAPDATVLRVVDAPLTVGGDTSAPEDSVFGPTGEIALSNARIELQDTSLKVRRGGRLSGSGRVDGSGIGSLVTNDGVIDCGVAIHATYSQGDAGVLECAQASPPTVPQLNPLLASRFARAVRAKVAPPPPPPPGPLVVTGDATLGGTLVLQFLNGFAPSQGDAFDLLEVSGNVTGSFANVSVRGLAPGADFAQDFAGGKLVLTSLTDAESLPVVSVKARASTTESKSKKGLKVKFSRQGDTSQPLTLHYVLHGTARNGFDYDELPGTLELPARKKTAKLVLHAFADGVPEGAESFSLELLPGEGYTTSLFKSVELAIGDEKPKRR